ncbi:type VI secretion system Vgr family protein [Paraburkholderia sp. J63]|uniref:type VI secretion system Vgr family protein n=1 Tax=Paraburkholderia sp. J63 TaxID=2805434 RepID=UPI002ABE8263|nr:type VI secretion system tip protein TssI/VgrG [Paraburkholderia sp. J63]
MTSQDTNRHVTVSCKGTTASLLFLRMTGSDELGRLSEYRVDLLCEQNSVTPAQVLGQDLSIALTLPAGGERQFNGIVTVFRMTSPGNQQYGSMAGYQAIVRPRLWLLTRGSHCRFYYEKTVPEIVMSVLNDYNVDVTNRCTATYSKREHCAQYRESDFDFVSRLMEHEGIYYYFEHARGRETMVLADAGDVHGPIPDYRNVPYRDRDAAAREEMECVYEWFAGGELQTGYYETNDYDFEKPSSSLQGGLRSRATRTQTYDAPSYTMQEHLTGHTDPTDGDRYARVGVEIRQARNDSIEGRSTMRGVWPGGLLQMSEHPVDSCNDGYLVVRAVYEINSDTYVSNRTSPGQSKLPFFDCAFTALRKDNQFRAERLTPRAVVGGLQTAVVVGDSGSEIFTDEYGRIKVQFHWEQLFENEDSQVTNRCWARVAQGWAGKTWGMFFLPRVGQEVIVEFIEGDPDHPLVTGSVYNASLMPPYTLPANSAFATIKSNSTPNASGNNEVRFLDKAGGEQLFFHAQKDHETWVINDALMNVGNDRHLKVTANEYMQVSGDRHDHVSGAQNAKVDGTASLTVGEKLQEKVGTDYAIDAGQNIHIKAGMNVVIEAGMSITLKAGGAFVVIGPSSVAVSGMPIQLNSGGSAGSGDGSSPTAPTDPKDADDGTKKIES